MPSWFAPVDNVRQAILRGDLPAVRRLFELEQLPREVADAESRDTLFALACGAGHVEIVAYLTNRGWSDVGGGDPRYAAYAFAAMENGHLEVIRWLCEEGYGLEDYTREHKYGLRLIDAAVKHRRTEIVRYLLSQGHKIDVPWVLEYNEAFGSASLDYDDDEAEPSSIEYATRAGAVELVEFLCEVGVDLGEYNCEHYRERARQNHEQYAGTTARQEALRTELKNYSARARSPRRSWRDEKITVKGSLALILFWVCFILVRWYFIEPAWDWLSARFQTAIN